MKHVNVWGGLIAPVPLAIYAGWCLATQRSVLMGEEFNGGIVGLLHVCGTTAVAMRICYLGVAMALHSFFVGGRLRHTWQIGRAGLVIGLVTALGSFTFVLYRFVIGLDWGSAV